MSIFLKEGGSSVPVPVGVHYARCFRIVELGRQPDSGFGEKEKLMISWELPNEMIEFQDDSGQQQRRPMSISKTYSATMGKKGNLRQDLARWRGREFTAEEIEKFDIASILGKACQISVIHGENGKAKVDAIMAMPKGVKVPDQINPSVEYNFKDREGGTFRALPDFLQKIIKSAVNWSEAKPKIPPTALPPNEAAQAFESDPEDEDIPF